MAKSFDKQLLRELPSVDALLKTATAQRLVTDLGANRLTMLARAAVNDLRHDLLKANGDNSDSPDRTALLKRAEALLLELHRQQIARGLRRVINATGVILHTNLGRAPLSEAARDALQQASGYCTLEFDTITGSRGRRGGRAEDLLTQLTGAEGSLIVNNCAAAALLVLYTFARDGQTIVSRGELVEIGGDFRVPDVMAQSGSRMIDVGTTNRTRLSDYRDAINDETRMIMRVHTSNYRIVGFTKTPSLTELAAVAHDSGVLLYEDAGSGALIDFSQFGVEGEPVVRESIQQGADVLSFSADKLLGGPQAGLIVGRAELIEQMRRSPLYRALRADKLRLAALEATLDAYAREERVPVSALIGLTAEEIGERSERLLNAARKVVSESIRLEKVAGESAVGGGSAPTSPLPTFLISISSSDRSPNEILAALRRWDPPIIVRIEADQVLIDLRTVTADEETQITQALASL